MPPDLAADMADAGFFRLLLPRELGGAELAHPDFLNILEMFAGADASVAWCLNQNNVFSYQVHAHGDVHGAGDLGRAAGGGNQRAAGRRVEIGSGAGRFLAERALELQQRQRSRHLDRRAGARHTGERSGSRYSTSTNPPAPDAH